MPDYSNRRDNNINTNNDNNRDNNRDNIYRNTERDYYSDPYHKNDHYDSLDDMPETDTPPTTPEEPSRRSLIIAEIFSYIKILVAAILIAFITTHFIIVNAQVPSGSMNNTIMEGDRLVGFRLSYMFSEPERGDIVIFKYPDDETQNYVKRVIGIPGDVIQVKNGHVYVNDVLQDEDYIKEPMIITGVEETYVIPEGHYFMMGDNRNNSLDSRKWTNTYVSKDKILAKVIFRYYDGKNRKIDFSTIK